MLSMYKLNAFEGLTQCFLGYKLNAFEDPKEWFRRVILLRYDRYTFVT